MLNTLFFLHCWLENLYLTLFSKPGHWLDHCSSQELWCWHGLLDLGLVCQLSEFLQRELRRTFWIHCSMCRSLELLTCWFFLFPSCLLSFSCIVTLLLRCNLHSIQSTYWKCTVHSTLEAEARGLLQVWGQSSPCSKFQASPSCVVRAYLKQANSGSKYIRVVVAWLRRNQGTPSLGWWG